MHGGGAQGRSLEQVPSPGAPVREDKCRCPREVETRVSLQVSLPPSRASRSAFAWACHIVSLGGPRMPLSDPWILSPPSFVIRKAQWR
ncbi:hypothetical protein NPIL_667541 [Nephila pilipes]|uniref:Uncharacterized protein n=1 Tax=Nephila pilipes TaxID=299642 RepID=A0A8X6TG87_NEPPI|nr:hypothetical protein NPIL_667541 [Nephila pilipes]